MRRRRVDSSAIRSMGYDPESRTLEVEFQSGSIYDYFGVSSRLWASLQGAPSKGSFFARQIRGRFPSERAG
jgi:KTSC domain